MTQNIQQLNRLKFLLAIIFSFVLISSGNSQTLFDSLFEDIQFKKVGENGENVFFTSNLDRPCVPKSS